MQVNIEGVFNKTIWFLKICDFSVTNSNGKTTCKVDYLHACVLSTFGVSFCPSPMKILQPDEAQQVACCKVTFIGCVSCHVSHDSKSPVSQPTLVDCTGVSLIGYGSVNDEVSWGLVFKSLVSSQDNFLQLKLEYELTFVNESQILWTMSKPLQKRNSF